MTYTGYHKLTARALVMWIVLFVPLSYVPVLAAFFPDAYEELINRPDPHPHRGKIDLRGVPRPLVVLVFGLLPVVAVWRLGTAIWTKKPAVVMNSEGVTYTPLLGRSTHIAWWEVDQIEQNWLIMRFVGRPTGRRPSRWLSTIGLAQSTQTNRVGFVTVSVDLNAIWAVVAHYRSDLRRRPS